MATNGLNLQASGLKLTTGTVERQIITNLGAFGFGTITPSTDFHFVGTGATTGIRFEGLAASSSDSNYLVADANGVLSTRNDVVTLDGTQTLTNKTITGSFTGDLTGNADTATALETARNFSITGDITASAISFDGTGNVVLNASIDANTVDTAELVDGAVTTVKIADLNVTNAKLANSTMSFVGTTGGNPEVALGGSLTFVSSDSSVVISGNSTSDTFDIKVGPSVDTYVTGGTFTSGSLTLKLNDGTDAQDISGFWTNIPNSALINDDITIGTTSIALGASSTTLAGLTSVTSTSFVGDLTGNADTADKWSTARTLTLGTDLTGNVSIDGSANVTLNASLAANTVDTAELVDGGVTNAKLANDSVTITAGAGLTTGGSVALGSSVTVDVDYAGANNVILDTTSKIGTPILPDWNILVSDTAQNAEYYSVGDLPFTNNLGTVTSVAITGTDGIDVDSGSPITTSGTIQLGLSNVPNSSLANSSMTYVGTSGTNPVVSLGGSLTFTSSDGSVVVNGNSGTDVLDLSVNVSAVDSFVTGGTINSPANGTLRLRLNNGQSNVDITGFSLDSSADSGSSTYYMGDTIDFNGGTGITTADNGTGTITFTLDDTAVTTGSYGSASETVTFTVDQQGRLTAASEQSIAITASQVTDFNTEVLADVFTAANFVDSSEVNFTVTAGASVTAALIDGSIANARLVNDSVTVSAGSGLTGGGSVDLGGSVTVSHADTSSVSNVSSNNSNGVVLQDLSLGFDGFGHVTGATVGTVDLDSRFLAFRTINVPSGTDPVADSYNDTLNFTSSNGSVVISGNSGSDTIDITVSSSVDTNIYNSDGTLTGARTVTQAGNALRFTGGDFSVDGTTFSVDDSQNAVGVGVSTPDASAVLEVSSNSKGFLFPRMTEAQRLGIGAPATGLLVYQTDAEEGVYIYKSFGWVQMI
jgi:hypothetical protein